MNRWQRWRAKHWDERLVPGRVVGCVVLMPSLHTPPLRRRVRAAWRDVWEHRWVVFAVTGGLIAASIHFG
ncbi:hypothetical protein [Pigmentiphaga soli]